MIFCSAVEAPRNTHALIVVMNFSQIPRAGAHYSEPRTGYRSGR